MAVRFALFVGINRKGSVDVFFSSKKKRRGGRFLFLKKRNKRHCGAVDLSVNRCFPARPARNKKTDGSHLNRPFCAARWRKRQEHRRKAAPQLIFFCFFSSKKKRRGTFSFLEEKKQKTLRGRFSFGEKDVSRTSDPIVQKNGRFPYEPSVLCNTLAKATGTQKESCSAIDFLLLPFLSRKKRKTPYFSSSSMARFKASIASVSPLSTASTMQWSI